MRLLRTDAVAQTAVAGAVTALALRSLPGAGDWRFEIQTGTDLFFVLMTIVALLAGLAELPARDERDFWRTIACGFATWALIVGLYLLIPDSWWTTGFDLVGDSLYLVFYLFLLAAVEGRPDLRFERRIFSVSSRYRVPGTMVFSVGLFLYFVAIPAVLNPELYGSWSPSLLLYLTLDFYLAVRLLVLAKVAQTARWRRCFALTAAVACVYLISDSVELLELRELIPQDPGMPLEALWLVPSLVTIAVVRLRGLPVAETESLPSESGWPAVEILVQGAPFLTYALLLPLIHFAAYRAAFFGDLTRAVHEDLVLVWLLTLGAVSLIQYLDLKRQRDSLLDQRRSTEERLWNLANFDQLTGLPNRVLFRDRFSHALKQARRNQRLLAVIFFDLDDFKRVNDSFGHAAGDQLLRQVAQRLVGCVRDSDTVARLGGDEFTIILEELDEIDQVERLGRRISRELSRPFELGGVVVTLRSSLGIGVFPRDGETVDALLASADAAMYDGKRSWKSEQS